MRKQENPCYGLLIVVIFVTSCVAAQSDDAIKKICETEENQRRCQSCISANPRCSWCEKVELKTKRCTLHSENLKNCIDSTIVNPMSHVQLEKNEPFTVAGPDFFDNDTNTGKTVLQMRPQNITVKLRKGQSVKVNVTFNKVIDYPLDIYYVMDLSYSMNDDLKVLQKLGTNLFEDLKQNVTKNVQLGFGSFVDKVMMPFASTVTEQLENPCASQPNKTECATPFGFRHQVSITGSAAEFNEAIQSTKISGNIDIPEGSFDALMQIAVCEHIKWRDGATRVILLTTDASPHIANDGKLAAILEANDMKCHLQKGANSRLPDAIVYAKSKTMDYPSLGQLKDAFQKNKIHSIFAVTADVHSIYKDIPSVLSNAYVAELLTDSSNIIPLINQTYGTLKGRLVVESSKPPTYVQQTNRVFCPNKEPSAGGEMKCEGIEIGNEVIFEFEFTASECPSDPNHRDAILLTSSSLQDEVTINLEYICECDCQSTGTVNNTQCSYHGSLTCGVCACDSGREGTSCQCDSANQNGTSVLDSCKRPGSEIFCEDKGSCDCGECKCNDGFTGKNCECKTTGCPTNEAGVCGDDSGRKGFCKICPDSDQKCICNEALNYTLKATDQTCSCHPDVCKQSQNSEPCNGLGQCKCDKCECNDPAVWAGTYCQNCVDPKCTGVDATCAGEEIRKCAECKTKNDDCSAVCSTNEFLLYSSVASFPNCANCMASTSTWECKECARHNTRLPFAKDCVVTMSGSDCRLNYQIHWLKSNVMMTYIKRFVKERDCPSPRSTLAIALPVVLSILFIGVAILFTWKCYQIWRDKKNYELIQKRKSGSIAMNLSSKYKDKKRKSSGYSGELNNTAGDEMESSDQLNNVVEEERI